MTTVICLKQCFTEYGHHLAKKCHFVIRMVNKTAFLKSVIFLYRIKPVKQSKYDNVMEFFLINTNVNVQYVLKKVLLTTERYLKILCKDITCTF